MPFGLVNSGATFCRLMRQVLANVPNVDSFVDDMWIFTETDDDDDDCFKVALASRHSGYPQSAIWDNL